jgi:dUTP pyrophosphatase
VLLVNLGGIAQLVIAPVLRVALVEADALDATPRAAGGFGSTGTRTREEP